MRSLWKSSGNFIQKVKRHLLQSAYSSDSFFVKGVSRLAFFRNFRNICGARLAAGMTVEAAVVLPLFLFFFINLGCAMEMIRLHGNLQLALWNTGNKMCVYGYITSGRPDNAQALGEQSSAWEDLKDIVLDNGTSGLQFWESGFLADHTAATGEIVDIMMTYQVSP